MSHGNYRVLNFNDVIGSEIENEVAKDIRNFRSNNNDDVERFLKLNAMNFCKLKQGITYLIYDKSNRLAAYFTLALKVLDFPMESLSKSVAKILERVGQKSDNVITVPGILLAQWSKNFSYENAIRGDDMMGYVKEILHNVQYLVGGSFVFLECEAEKERLARHYENMGFVKVAERLSQDGNPLVQFIKKI